MIKKLKRVHEKNETDNPTGNEGISALSWALRVNTSLHTLHICSQQAQKKGKANKTAFNAETPNRKYVR